MGKPDQGAAAAEGARRATGAAGRLEPTDTVDFSKQQQHIVNYVMLRQRERLQSRVER